MCVCVSLTVCSNLNSNKKSFFCSSHGRWHTETMREIMFSTLQRQWTRQRLLVRRRQLMQFRRNDKVNLVKWFRCTGRKKVLREINFGNYQNEKEKKRKIFERNEWNNKSLSSIFSVLSPDPDDQRHYEESSTTSTTHRF